MTRITIAAPLALVAIAGGCGETTVPANTVGAGDATDAGHPS